MEQIFLLCVFSGGISLLFVLLGLLEKWIPESVMDRLVSVISGEKKRPADLGKSARSKQKYIKN